MSTTERWEPGGVVLADDGAIWARPVPGVWQYLGLGYHPQELPHPVRPLTLLVRNGQSMTSRVCTRCGDGDLYPRRCSQCGQRWIDRACGPTHALIASELGVTARGQPHGVTQVRDR